MERNVEPPMGGLVCDLLWADPMRIELPEGQTEETQDEIMEGLLSATFVPNTARDCSYYFGYAALISFLNENGLIGLIRAHEVQRNGFHKVRCRK